MKIIVCIKQVPGTNKVEIDLKTSILKRDGAQTKKKEQAAALL